MKLCQRLILVIPSPSLCHTWKESIFLFSSIFQLCQLCFHVDSFINFSSKWNIKGCQTEIYCREIVFLLLNGKLLERKGWFLTILFFSSTNRIFSIFEIGNVLDFWLGDQQPINSLEIAHLLKVQAPEFVISLYAIYLLENALWLQLDIFLSLPDPWNSFIYLSWIYFHFLQLITNSVCYI